jgi:hypothetical protein
MARSVFIWLALVSMSFSSDVREAEPPVERLQIHPRVFGLITCWPSDGEEPVVTEINLDAVSKNRNQFDMSLVKTRGVWTECPGSQGQGFERYRVVKSDDGQVTIEFQSNGGGTYTSVSIMEFVIEPRELRQNGKLVSRRILRIVSIATK